MPATKPKHKVTTENMYDILTQPIGLEEIYVRRDGRAARSGRIRCVAYVKWPTIRRVLMEVDPLFDLVAVQTTKGDDPFVEEYANGKMKRKMPQVHYYATRSLVLHVWDEERQAYAEVRRAGTGEDDNSPKAAETDAGKRAGYNFGVVHQLFEDDFYVRLGLPGGTFWVNWPTKYEFEGGVPLSTVLVSEKAAFKPGDARSGWIKKVDKALDNHTPQKKGNGGNGALSGSGDSSQGPQEFERPKDLALENLLEVSAISDRYQIPKGELTLLVKMKYGKASTDMSVDETIELLDLFQTFTSRAAFGSVLKELRDAQTAEKK